MISLAVVGALPSLALASGAGMGTLGQDRPCSAIAILAHRAARHELREDLLLGLAECVNLADPADFPGCMDEAWEEYRDGLDEVEEVYEARRGICRDIGEDVYAPEIDPADFTSDVDHPFFPLVPGMTRTYEKSTDEGLEVVEVTALRDTKQIAGVECRVVRDRVTLDGELIEDTFDWFAQDLAGNVWYFGELAMDYEDGELVSLDGSWRAGEDGAHAGIIMAASPLPGQTFRQEYYLDEAEDVGTVVALGVDVSVPFGDFAGCIQTEDYTPLEPDAREHKFYAMGVGPVLEVDLDSGERLELVDVVQS